MFEFHVVPGAAVEEILDTCTTGVRERVADTYRAHEGGQTVNPDSYFLRFPEKPDSRVIALPAYLGSSINRIGLKWISSFPGNVATGIPRASAVLILNDYATGHPVACLEAAGISAARTAASAALAATVLAGKTGGTLSFVGAGVIARTILRHLADAGIPIRELSCHDLDQRSAESLLAYGENFSGFRRSDRGIWQRHSKRISSSSPRPRPSRTSRPTCGCAPGSCC